MAVSQQRGGATPQKGSHVNRNRVLVINYLEDSQTRHCPQRNHLVKTADTVLISTENIYNQEPSFIEQLLCFRPCVGLWQAGFHHDLRGLWEAPSAVGGFGEGQKAQSAQLRVTGKREEPGRWAGRHHGDFLPGTVSQG